MEIGILVLACGSSATVLLTKALRRPGLASTGSPAKQYDILPPQAAFISRHGF